MHGQGHQGLSARKKKEEVTDAPTPVDYARIEAFLCGYGRKTEKESACTSFSEYRHLVGQYEQERRDAWELARWTEWRQEITNPYIKQKPRTPHEVLPFPWDAEQKEEREVTPDDCKIDADMLQFLNNQFDKYNGKDR